MTNAGDAPAEHLAGRPSLLDRMKQRPVLAVAALILGAVSVTLALPDSDKSPAPQGSHGEPAPDIQPEVDPQAAQEAFLARINDHDPIAFCLDNVGVYGSMPALAQEWTGDPSLWPEFLAKSPFSHLESVIAGSEGQVIDKTTQRSRIDIALDSTVANQVRGTKYECRLNDEGILVYELSDKEIYPSGIPSPEVVQSIVNNTATLKQVGIFPDPAGFRGELNYSVVHVGNGIYLTPWIEKFMTHTYPDADTDPSNDRISNADVTESTLRGYSIDETAVVDLPIHRFKGSERHSYIETDQIAGPELELGDTTDIEPGDTVIISSYDDHEYDGNEKTLSFYRAVVIERRDNGQLVVATGVEDSGSRQSHDLYPHSGSWGSGIYDMNDVLVGTLAGSGGYDIQYSYEDGDDEAAMEDAPWQNEVIDFLSTRLGYPTPQEMYEAELKEKYPTYSSWVDHPFASIAVINPIPVDEIEELRKAS